MLYWIVASNKGFTIKAPTPFQSPQSLVLRFMREKRKLTILSVGKMVGMKPKNVDHMEHGRRIATEEEVLTFLECYGFSFEIYSEMLLINPLNKQTANHFFLNKKIFK
jgi:hypothetical protein